MIVKGILTFHETNYKHPLLLLLVGIAMIIAGKIISVFTWMTIWGKDEDEPEESDRVE